MAVILSSLPSMQKLGSRKAEELVYGQDQEEVELQIQTQKAESLAFTSLCICSVEVRAWSKEGIIKSDTEEERLNVRSDCSQVTAKAVKIKQTLY